MTPEDERTVRQWAARQQVATTILLARGQGAGDERVALFGERLGALAPAVRIEKVDEAFRSPALIIGKHQNIAYQAVPEGRELALFLEALASAGGDGHMALPQDIGTAIGDIEVPAELTLFIAMQCPHCPTAVRQLLSLCATVKQLRLTIVDGVRFADLAAAHGIRAVPTLILEDQLRWSGSIDLADVVRQCIQRDPVGMSAAGLRQILEAGKASRAAAMMIEHNRIFPALIALLTHERWSVRLGAMVTVEYLSDEAPDLAAELVDPLWCDFTSLTEPVQGDVVQVLGQIKSDAALLCLQKIASGDFAETVRQAAAEELQDT
jgi:hypothetical protein